METFITEMHSKMWFVEQVSFYLGIDVLMTMHPKGPVTRRMFPFGDVTMILNYVVWEAALKKIIDSLKQWINHVVYSV